ncbi:class IIb bacteriocin, lactobin A/cerein 7B family [Staphylococcus equorum]|uniref:class IIb bacteriocin, lactobin A/cerein 7B family n=1 Tax=Staphylococcus TaxID=1279 RepID=UPI000D1C929E|nr:MULTISPECIES: class IIb bacteriocin, lactobin A/cerein 7B family [Staphylococcus]PTE27752.1 hypothetical protein BUY91_07490 [Staphylococcus equorum]PTE81915.1 hypothetical protein BUY90_12965 [Staphylococcus equorum]PTE95310.1 hypothetical protein BUY87_12965 [Staphylococcus equorum]RIL35302.1 class IIb bacteriocin, lactobin A/cerein 7B family [Staphylococcus equorum]RIO24516.1 class IIb bacteriocin, lactobin A/cerein 7B family [Staphylococcus saprophyticus]
MAFRKLSENELHSTNGGVWPIVAAIGSAGVAVYNYQDEIKKGHKDAMKQTGGGKRL